jgi:hypothetical protein
MAFRRLGRGASNAASPTDSIVPGALSGAAAHLRAIVTATDRAVEHLEGVSADHRTGTGGRSKDHGQAIEAGLVDTLVSRARDLRDDAEQLMQVLESSLRTLGADPELLRATSPHAEPLPFARRSTDPGGHERLQGAPGRDWLGPERRRAGTGANMPESATGNGKRIANGKRPNR